VGASHSTCVCTTKGITTMPEFTIDADAFPLEAQQVMDAAEAAGADVPSYPKNMAMLAIEADIQ